MREAGAWCLLPEGAGMNLGLQGKEREKACMYVHTFVSVCRPWEERRR